MKRSTVSVVRPRIEILDPAVELGQCVACVAARAARLLECLGPMEFVEL